MAGVVVVQNAWLPHIPEAKPYEVHHKLLAERKQTGYKREVLI